jgi:FkbM family methyltransferase
MFHHVEHQDIQASFYKNVPVRHQQTRSHEKGRFYESEMLSVIRSMIPNDTHADIVDIGANVGNHTVFFAHAFPNAMLHAFEPDSRLHQILLINLVGNRVGLHRITAWNLALGQRSGLAGVVGGNDGNPRLLPSARGTIPMAKLDEILSVRTLDKRIILIKCDAEGMEPNIIAGGSQIIQRDKPMMFVECSTKDECDEVDSLLLPMGYERRRRFNATPTWMYMPV